MSKSISPLMLIFGDMIPVFRELITNVECNFVSHYVTEYFLKLSVIMDLCDVLEFGRLRSQHFLVSQKKYNFDGKTGSYGKPNACELGLQLTVCSFDGLSFCLKKHKVCFLLLRLLLLFLSDFLFVLQKIASKNFADVNERNAFEEECETFLADLQVNGTFLSDTRKSLVDTTQELMIDALCRTVGNNYLANTTSFINFHNFKAFEFVYTKKANSKDKNNKTTKRLIKIHMFEEMLTAQDTHKRDLVEEFVKATIPEPVGFSHSAILSALQERMSLIAARKSLDDAEKLNQRKQAKIEKLAREIRSKEVLLSQQASYALMTPVEKLAFDQNLSDGRRLAKNSFNTQAKTENSSDSEDDSLSSSSSSSSDVEEEDEEEEVGEQPVTTSTVQPVTIKIGSSMSTSEFPPGHLKLSLRSLSDDDSMVSDVGGGSTSRPRPNGRLKGGKSVAPQSVNVAAILSMNASITSHQIPGVLEQTAVVKNSHKQQNYSESSLDDVLTSKSVITNSELENVVISSCDEDEDEGGDDDGNISDGSSNTEGMNDDDGDDDDEDDGDSDDEEDDVSRSERATIVKKRVHSNASNPMMTHHVLDNGELGSGDELSVVGANGLSASIKSHSVLLDDGSTKPLKKRKRQSAAQQLKAAELAELSEDKQSKKAANAATKAAAAAAKLLADKALREKKLFDHRVRVVHGLLAKEGRFSDTEQGSQEDASSPDKKARKARVSSGMGQSLINFYVADYKLNELDKAIVEGVSKKYLIENTDGESIEDQKKMERTMVQNYRAKLEVSCDATFKLSMEKHIHEELFKEVVLERMVTAYMIAKREAVNAQDDDLIDIDWVELLTEFGKTLKTKLKSDNQSCLEKIEMIIDNCENIKASDKAKLKVDYFSSMDVFKAATLRKIQTIISRLIVKISNLWEGLNFSSLGENGLPSHKSYKRKSKGRLFAFAACAHNSSGGNSIDDELRNAVVGIDMFTKQVLGACKNSGGHMDRLVAYKLLPKGQYYNIPINDKELGDVLAKASSLQRAKDVHPTKISLALSPDKANPSTPPAALHQNGNGSSLLNTSFGSNNDDDEEIGFSPSFVGNAVAKFADVSVDFPESFPDKSMFSTGEFYKNCMATVAALKLFLKELFTDVCGVTDCSALRLNIANNSRNSENLAFVEFMESHMHDSSEQLYSAFVESKFYKSLTCRWMIPFARSEFDSILPDGYCFYRALFQLMMRAYDDYRASLAEMKSFDTNLKFSNDSGGGRKKFFEFFAHLEKLLPESYGKSRVMNAHMTFFNMKCGLDEAFWGVIDAAAFVDFNCTAFVYCKDSGLDGFWAQYKCSSLFAISCRDLVVESMVGTGATFEDVSFVVRSPPNYVILKNRHYFLTEHKAQDDMMAANAECTSQILVKLQRKIVSASNLLRETGGLTLSDIYQRTISKSCSSVDKRFMDTATEAITSDQRDGMAGGLDNDLPINPMPALDSRAKELKKHGMGDLVASCATQEQIKGVIENLVRNLA